MRRVWRRRGRLRRSAPRAWARGGRSGPRRRGLAARRTARADGVHLRERIEALGEDGLISPLAATVLNVLRRSLAIALAMGEEYGARSGVVGAEAGQSGGAVGPVRSGARSPNC